MLRVPWLNDFVPQTLYLNHEFLDTWRQRVRPGIRLDRESACLSLPGIKESLQWVLGEQHLPGVKEGVNASGCLSELGKLRVAEKQQVGLHHLPEVCNQLVELGCKPPLLVDALPP